MPSVHSGAINAVHSKFLFPPPTVNSAQNPTLASNITTAPVLRQALHQQVANAGLIPTLLLDALASSASTIRTSTAERMPTAASATSALKDSLAGIWVSDSMKRRSQLLRRLANWCLRENLPVTPESAVLFVTATGITVQGQHSYAKTLSGTLRHLGFNTQPLLTFATALRAQGAAVPLHQAKPITRDLLLSWAFQQPRDVLLACMIAWKTASRWKEVVELKKQNIIWSTCKEVIIDWSTIPKGRRANPYQASKFTVITGDLTTSIHAALSNLKDKQLCAVSTSELDHLWSGDGKMAGYSAHSIKRGALTHLMERAVAAQLDPVKISLLAKHQHVNVLAQNTIRYGANPVALARLLGTADATKLL